MIQKESEFLQIQILLTIIQREYTLIMKFNRAIPIAFLKDTIFRVDTNRDINESIEEKFIVVNDVKIKGQIVPQYTLCKKVNTTVFDPEEYFAEQFVEILESDSSNNVIGKEMYNLFKKYY